MKVLRLKMSIVSGKVCRHELKLLTMCVIPKDDVAAYKVVHNKRQNLVIRLKHRKDGTNMCLI